jgi:esterase/lipase superfamily enzyme
VPKNFRPGRAPAHPAWSLEYDTATARIENENVFVHVVIDAEEPEQPNTALPSVPPRELCQTFKLACEATPLADQATVDFLFATTRAKLETKGKLTFSGDRSENVTFGAAGVFVPENHGFGRIELRKSLSLRGYTFYEEKLDPSRHFVGEVRELDESSWNLIVENSGRDEALIFVHGFDTSFVKALYREAQIDWDLRFQSIPLLFTWASNRSVLDYVYDQQSALMAGRAFCLRKQQIGHGRLGSS